MPEEEKDVLRQRLSDLAKNEIADLRFSTGKRFLITNGKDGEPVRILLKMRHQSQEGRPVTFTMSEESDGTQRMLHLIPALFMLKEQPEKVVVLDELDRRFHTHLSRMFLQAALDCQEDRTHSQLIFTTHDTNLLDLDLLRRDEIWFAEKDKRGASHIYSLAEFKIRPDLRIEKGYLSGRFGAIPFIGDISCLGLKDEEEDEKQKEVQTSIAGIAA